MTQTLEYRTQIREMPADERPRERLRMRGAEALSNPELIAILLRTGSNGENVVALAQRILAKFGGLSGLGGAGFGQLCAEHAVGEAKAAQLLAAIELGKRIVHARPPERRVIRSPEDIYALLFADMALLDQEHVNVILLNQRNEVVALREVYRGNVSSAVVRVAEVFRDAVRDACPSIVVAHNHPSGDPSPSAEDAQLTKQLVEAGRLLGVEVVDHIVIARHGYASLRDLKMGFG